MTYPQQPGQYPDQQPPGQYPTGGYPPAPPAPYPNYPGGIDPMARPSGGTAITAAVLAIIGAAWAIFICIGGFSTAPDAQGPLSWMVWMQAVVYLVEVCTLLPGAILMLTRKPIGRWLVVLGCAIHIVQGIVAVIAVAGAVSDQIENSAQAFGAGTVGLVVVLAPAIATLVLALVPLTGRWIAWGRQPAQQQ